MATYTKMIQDSKVRRRKLMASVESHRKSIGELEREVKQLDAVISSLERLTKSPKGPGRKVRAPGTTAPRKTATSKTKARRRGTWKPGKPGRPPKWYQEKQEAKKAAAQKPAARKPAAKKPGAKAAKKPAPKKRKKKLSAKQLAGLAKARAARLANLKKEKAAGE